MKFVDRGHLDTNYRQPASIVDMTASQFGGQRGALLVQYVDGDSVEGRKTRYVDVNLTVNVGKAVVALLSLGASAAIQAMQKLNDQVFQAYVAALPTEVSEVCAGPL